MKIKRFKWFYVTWCLSSFQLSQKVTQESLSLVYISAFSSLSCTVFHHSLVSPPTFIPGFPSQFILNFFPLWLNVCLPFLCLPLPLPLLLSLSSIATHFCFLWSVKNDRLQDEVDRICRRNGLTKWIAAFLAIHHRPEATAVKICEGAGLLITSCNYKVSDSVFVAWQGGGGEVGEGGWWWVEGNAGSCSALKNPLLIDFKWWNIDFCPVQGLAEQVAAICRRYNAGHPVLLATISHSDMGKMREEARKGEKRERRREWGREINQWLNPLLSLNSGGIGYVKRGQNTSWIILWRFCIYCLNHWLMFFRG